MGLVRGTDKPDTLYATTNGDTVLGFDGNDRIFGHVGADVILGGNGDDWIFGADGADTIYGGNDNDVLRGGAGADRIDGGAGTDTVCYDDSGYEPVGVVVTLTGAIGTGNQAQGDRLVSIENLSGSYFNDVLIGDNNRNTLNGQPGADYLKGGGGDDTLIGEHGDDVLKGGGGEDTLNGGIGSDTADYYWSAAGVTVYLINDTASGGDAEGDDLNGIENLSGSGHNDDLWGDNGANVLRGMNGADTLKGFGGADTLQGGNHNDTLNGGTGIDTLTGDAGADRFLFNTALNAATNVDTITDFSVVDDLIRLDDAIFTGIGPLGVLNPDAFHIGAADAEDRIVYNSATGQLFFDSNGSAAGGMTLFARLSIGLPLSNTDFQVV